MKPSLSLLLVLCFAFSFSQEREIVSSQPSVDIISVPVSSDALDKSPIDFNPNGVKVYYESDLNFVNLRFKNVISFLQIEFLDKKGRMINTFKGRDILQLKINLARLKKGKYYVRVNSRDINDFIKITKE